MLIGVDHFDVMVGGDVSGGDLARPLLGEHQLGFVAGVHAHRHFLQIQEDFDDIFLDAFDGAVFMQHLVLNLRFGDGRARHAGKQQAAQGIAERVAETAFQRLDGDAGPVGVATFFHPHDARL